MNLNANPNTHWASVFVEELAANGLEAVCIAPGSRSTPLTLAFAAQSGVQVYRHLDERSAGFFALGLALASDRPVALVCTSGSAAANFHPAIIEAYYSNVPLLILTADRPPELRGSGANQTIDQIKMYGDHVRWSVEVPTPQADAGEVVVRHMRTLAARVYATADGLIKGPVHLNFPFRKPLEPDDAPNGRETGDFPSVREAPRPFTRFSRGRILPDEKQVSTVTDTITSHPHGLIICGPGCPGGTFPDAVAALAESSGYPILADPLSNLRHGPQTHQGYVLGGYNLWLRSLSEALPPHEVVIRFGTVPTSAVLNNYLGAVRPRVHVHVREDGQWADDQHLTHEVIQADPAALCASVAAALTTKRHRPRPDWANTLIAAEAQAWKQLDKAMAQSSFFDGMAVAALLSAMPDDGVLFAGNSLPVRHVDAFARPSALRLTIHGNRGASGIDGNVSTALGLAAATGKRVVALLGDITFYHDMNGLLAVGQHALDNITFVVINNDGGGIFRSLPVARHDPPFTELFLTPHGLTFEYAAAMYGLDYHAVSGQSDLQEALRVEFEKYAGACLIEIRTDGDADYQRIRAVVAAVANSFHLAESLTG